MRYGYWFGRPGRREFKTVDWRTDWLLPILQAAACVAVIFLDLFFVESWLFILPPLYDWWLGVFTFILFPSILIMTATLLGAYLWNRLFKKPFSWKAIKVASRVAVGFAVVALILVLIDVLARQDIWWTYCQTTPDLALPIPHIEQGSNAVALGIFIVFVGIMGFLLHPGKYPLGVSIFGGVFTTVAQWIVPLVISFTWERPIFCYSLYFAWCAAWIVGTATLLFRFWMKEIPDPYIPEITSRIPVDEQGFDPFERSGRGEEGGV